MTLASEVPRLPYLGPMEDELRTAFTSAYTPATDACRTPYTAHLLGREMQGRGSPRARAERAFEVIVPHLIEAEVELQSRWFPTILPVTTVAAAQARIDARTSMTKSYTPHQALVIRRGWKRKKTTTRFAVKPSRRNDVFGSDVRHVESAKRLTLDLVTHVSVTQQNKMRRILLQSITEGVNPDVAGARIANVVGLMPRWQAAVDNFHRRMLDDGYMPLVARQRAKVYADSLLDKRGIMIARTELLRAMNDGRLAGWEDMVERGVILDDSVKEWVTGPDPCPDCEEMQGARVEGVDEMFDTPFGQMAMPPLHPHCKCGAVLIPKRGKQDDGGQKMDEATVNAFPVVSELLDHFGVAEGYWGQAS